MSQSFSFYLAHCVKEVVANKWDILRRGWPSEPDDDEKQNIRIWFRDTLLEVCKSYQSQGCTEIEISPNDDKEVKTRGISQIDEKAASTANLPSSGGEALVKLFSYDFHLRRPLIPSVFCSSDALKSQETHLAAARKLRHIDDRPSLPTEPTFTERTIKDYALRALWDWTSTLEFLASIKIVRDEEGQAANKTLVLGNPDPSIIDSFNSHITRGRLPNAIHTMIARLSRSLRMQVILTTNFDHLLEDSFQAQGESIYMLPVSIRDNVPAFGSVRPQDILIKLHGDIASTRADSTINDDASEADRKNFYALLRGPKPEDSTQPSSFIPSDLLVMGYSAGDARCVQMIKYVLERDLAFRCYWVCYSKDDVATVHKLFKDYRGRDPRVIITETRQPELLLWGLYQKINLALPGGGHPMLFRSLLPPESGKTLSAAEVKKQESLQEELNLYLKGSVSGCNGGFVCDSDGRILDYLKPVLSMLCQQHWLKLIWFEMEDYRGVKHLLHELLTQLAKGSPIMRHEWPGLTTTGTTKSVKDAVRQNNEKLKITAKDWLLSFYGRNGPGGTAGMPGCETNYWTQHDYKEFEIFRNELAELGFRVVYFPFTDKRKSRVDALEKSFNSLWKIAPGEPLETPVDPFSKDCNWEADADAPGRESFVIQAIKDIVNTLGKTAKMGEPGKERAIGLSWMHHICLFRQSRHPSSLISESVFDCPYKFNDNEVDNDLFRQLVVFGGSAWQNWPDEVKRDWPVKYQIQGVDGSWFGWMEWLKSKGYVLDKPGGFSWMYRDLRIKLRHRIEYEFGYLNKSQKSLRTNELSKQHHDLSLWYLKAHCSTGDPSPLFEALYHAASCISRFHLGEHSMKPNAKPFRTESRHFYAVLMLIRTILYYGNKCFITAFPSLDLRNDVLGSDSIHFFKGNLNGLVGKITPPELQSACQQQVTIILENLDWLLRTVSQEGSPDGRRTPPHLHSCGLSTSGASEITHDTNSIDTIDDAWANKFKGILRKLHLPSRRKLSTTFLAIKQ